MGKRAARAGGCEGETAPGGAGAAATETTQADSSVRWLATNASRQRHRGGRRPGRRRLPVVREIGCRPVRRELAAVNETDACSPARILESSQEPVAFPFRDGDRRAVRKCLQRDLEPRRVDVRPMRRQLRRARLRRCTLRLDTTCSAAPHHASRSAAVFPPSFCGFSRDRLLALPSRLTMVQRPRLPAARPAPRGLVAPIQPRARR